MNSYFISGPSSSITIYLIDEDSESDLETGYQEQTEVEDFTSEVLEQLRAQFLTYDDRPDEKSQYPIGVVRCAAHTLQLAMQDASNNVGIRALLAEVREVVRRIRTPLYVRILKEENKPVPKLDCPTRWHSAIDMVESLLNLKEICSLNERLQVLVSSTPWSALEDFVKSMTPAKLLTKKLQTEQLTVGNFYLEWMLCLYKLQNINTEISTTLFNKMKQRETALFDNDTFINGIFLDPRVNSILTPEQLERAKQNLIKLFFKYFIIEYNTHTSDASVTELASSSTIEARSAMEEFLSSCYINRQNDLNILIRRRDPQGEITTNIKQSFNAFLDEPLLKSSEDVLHYWEKSKNKFPLLYKLSKVVLAAPMTQVSVERLFSSLKFMVSNYRTSMKDNIIEDLLFLRSHHVFDRS